MNREQLLHGLRQLKVQTGSLACLGCQHEDNCGIKGCALICAAVEQLECSMDSRNGCRNKRKNKRQAIKKQAMGDNPDESAQETAGKRIPRR